MNAETNTIAELSKINMAAAQQPKGDDILASSPRPSPPSEARATALRLGHVPGVNHMGRAREGYSEEPSWIVAVEPWTEPVDGAALLAGLSALMTRFVVLPKSADVALALWTLHT